MITCLTWKEMQASAACGGCSDCNSSRGIWLFGLMTVFLVQSTNSEQAARRSNSHPTISWSQSALHQYTPGVSYLWSISWVCAFFDPMETYTTLELRDSIPMSAVVLDRSSGGCPKNARWNLSSACASLGSRLDCNSSSTGGPSRLVEAIFHSLHWKTHT